jgi:hypothetical protein
MARKPTETVKLQLRLSEAIRRRLERAASANHRSMNAEIVHRLEQSLKRDEEPEGVRDAMNEGMLKVIDVAAEVVRQIPPARHNQSLRAIDQAQRLYRPKVSAELTEDSIRQLALEVAEGVRRESRGEEPGEQLESKVSNLMDRLRQTSSKETSEQPATDKKEGSK